MAYQFLDVLKSKPSAFHLDWLQIEVSAVCNALCTYCVLKCYKEQWQGGLMDMETFARIEPAFPMTDLVFLQGWGEPLLHTQFWEMVQRVKMAGSNVGFTTNGMLLNAANQQHLLENDVDIVGISLAGTSPVMHERFRPDCKFAKLDAALLGLKKLKEEAATNKPKVHLAFMLLHSNWQEIEKLPDLAARWGVSQVVVSNLTWIGSEAMREESLLNHPELWDEITERLEQAKQNATARGIELNFTGPKVDEPRPVCTENIHKACFISYRGDVSPCVFTNLSLAKEKEVHHYFQGKQYRVEPLLFGNVHNKSLIDIWNARKACDFRTAFAERIAMVNPGTSNLPTPCKHCYKLIEQ